MAELGYNVEEIGPNEIKKLFPLARVDDIKAGFYLPQDGRVNPVDATMSLAKGARLLGVKVLEGVSVTGVGVRCRRFAGENTIRKGNAGSEGPRRRERQEEDRQEEGRQEVGGRETMAKDRKGGRKPRREHGRKGQVRVRVAPGDPGLDPQGLIMPDQTKPRGAVVVRPADRRRCLQSVRHRTDPCRRRGGPCVARR